MIKKSLTLKGKNIPWLAKRLGLSHQTIYDWENGKSRPTPEHLIAIASVLRISRGTLFDYFYY